MIKVGILETGYLSKQLAARHGNFPQMFRTYFAGQPDLNFTVYDIVGGNPVPKPTMQDAWIITGSPAAVYEDHAWLPPMREFVRAALAESVPVLGICFGHQLMAQALGGVVVKSDKGYGIGVHSYAVTEAGKEVIGDAAHLNLVVTHQDQVVELPAGATVLAGSYFCPYAALAYGEYGLSFQAHPELTIAAGRDIINRDHADAPVPQNVLDAAEISFVNVPSHSQRLVPVFRRFLGRGLNNAGSFPHAASR